MINDADRGIKLEGFELHPKFKKALAVLVAFAMLIILAHSITGVSEYLVRIASFLIALAATVILMARSNLWVRRAPLAMQAPEFLDKEGAKSDNNAPNDQWREHAYPLKQYVIVVQGTRHSTRESLISLLDEVVARLREGDDSGEHHDDDFGYTFSFTESPVSAFKENCSFK